MDTRNVGMVIWCGVVLSLGFVTSRMWNGSSTSTSRSQVVRVHLPDRGLYVGAADASVILVEFGSMTCQYCRDFAVNHWDGIAESYISPGDVRYRYVDVSGTTVGRRLAAATRCLAEEMPVGEAKRVVLSVAAVASSGDLMEELATVGAVEYAKLVGCVEGDVDRMWPAQERSAAGRIGVSGTPTFVVGRREGEDVVGWVLAGFDEEEMEAHIQAALSVEANRARGKGR